MAMDLSQLGKSSTTAKVGGIEIDYLKQPSLECEEEDEYGEVCGNHTFLPVYIFKKISAVLAPTGKEEIITMESYRCSACGSIPKIFPQ
jgi:hypothetical protein